MVNRDRNNTWLGGLALIAVGLVFLVQNFTGIGLGNWWALFILIPALWAFWRAWSLYQEDRHITRRVANTIYGGVFPFIVAMIFLLNLDWGRIWPVFLVAAGVGVVFGLGDKKVEEPQGPQYKV